MKHLSDTALVVLAGNYPAPAEAAIRDVLAAFTFDDVLIFADTALDVPVDERFHGPA